jgi:ATP-dependent protease La (LON) substrate-binding domain
MVHSNHVLTIVASLLCTGSSFLPSALAWISCRPEAVARGRFARCASRHLQTRWNYEGGDKDDGDVFKEFEDETDLTLKKKKRMDIVRTLQASFYQPDSIFSNEVDQTHRTASEQTLDNEGILFHIPMWHVSWTELPGRTNVLSIHDPVYTNMFESLLRNHERIRNLNNHSKSSVGLKGCYFGHVYRPPAESIDDDSNAHATVGTLMQISDYRRMEGGTLLLLVQGIERFAVTETIQERPYKVANVRLLPDWEEITTGLANSCELDTDAAATTIDNSSYPCGLTETAFRHARVAACIDAWSNWYPYEYKVMQLPVPRTKYVAISAISGSSLNAVLPFAWYDKDNQPIDNAWKSTVITKEPLPGNHSPQGAVGEIPLELTLLDRGLFCKVAVPDSLCELSLDELEIRLWSALKDFCVATNTTIPPVLLSLLPQGLTWPTGFFLQDAANYIHDNQPDSSRDQSDTDNNGDGCVRLSPFYPALRRQRRLSFAAAQLLERASVARDADGLNDLRKRLFRIPRYIKHFDSKGSGENDWLALTPRL